MSDIKNCDFCGSTKLVIKGFGKTFPGWSSINMNINTTASKEDDIASSYASLTVDICPECYKEKSFPKFDHYEQPTDPIRNIIFDIVEEALADREGEY